MSDSLLLSNDDKGTILYGPYYIAKDPLRRGGGEWSLLGIWGFDADLVLEIDGAGIVFSEDVDFLNPLIISKSQTVKAYRDGGYDSDGILVNVMWSPEMERHISRNNILSAIRGRVRDAVTGCYRSGDEGNLQTDKTLFSKENTHFFNDTPIISLLRELIN